MNIKFLFRYYLRFFILSYIFVFSCDIVFAINKPSHPNLFDKCTLENKCIPICIYGYENDNGEVIDNAYIGYYYDNAKNSVSPTDYIWELGHYYPTQVFGDKPYYSGDLVGNRIGWKDTDCDIIAKWAKNQDEKKYGYNDYTKLVDRFKCPAFFGAANYDSDDTLYRGSDEYPIAFSNSCSLGSKLTYSFAEELATVLDLTYYNMNIDKYHTPNDTVYGTDAVMTDFPDTNDLEILSLHDSEIKYNSSLSFDENLKNGKICEYLSKKNSSSYTEELISQGSVNYLYGNNISEKFKFIASKIGARNISLYDDYSTIKFLVDDKQNVSIKNQGKYFTNKYGVTMDYNYDRLDPIVTVSLKRALDNVIERCNVIEPSLNIELNTEEISDNYTKQVEISIHKNEMIDLESTFDCGTFFSGNLAKMIKNAYFIIEIGSLLIFIALSILDYAKVILNGDQDEMKKTNKNTIIRLIIVVSLFLLPAIINFVLGIFNIEGFDSEHPLCVEIKNK